VLQKLKKKSNIINVIFDQFIIADNNLTMQFYFVFFFIKVILL